MIRYSIIRRRTNLSRRLRKFACPHCEKILITAIILFVIYLCFNKIFNGNNKIYLKDQVSHEFPNSVPRYVMNSVQNDFTPSIYRYSKYDYDSRPSFPESCSKNNKNEIDLILVWTRFYKYGFFDDTRVDDDRYVYDKRETIHFPAYCSKMYPNCRLTDRREFYNQSDLIVFHWVNLDLSDIPIYRSSDQIWELFIHEPPTQTPELPNTVHVEFNATALYHSGSDMIIPYGEVERFDNPSYRPNIEWKRAPIVWFVSHCTTQSKRERYVAQLKKHIEITTFGACSKYGRCNKQSWDFCQQTEFRKHYFYLSFENSMCDEYVTEKLFLALQYDIVPIVYGAANYSSILPPHSYIDATKYRPKSLAKLLTSLMHDRKAYLQYFKWKRHYRIRTDRHADDHMICEACRYIREYKCGFIPRKSLSLKHINRYWSSTCWNEDRINRVAGLKAN